MRYTLKNPCADCPFLREGGIRLSKQRAKQIARAVTSNPGTTFACHSTVDYDAVDGAEPTRHDTRDSAHCYGALVLAEKVGVATQMMRIAERLGMYDAEQVCTNERAAASVFDTVEEMVRANGLSPRRSV